MKIGILTFSSAYNFGAVLQCYALEYCIRQLGFDVEVIEYVPEYLATKRPRIGLRTFVNRHPWKCPSIIRKIRKNQERFDLYKDFEKRYSKRSEAICTCEELRDLVTKYDYVVVGSDQIWNKKYNGNDEAWFGAGMTNKRPQWITYAASAGDPDFTQDELCDLKKRLETFSAVSVREKSLERIITPLLGNEIPHATVLDPSLLASEKAWEKWFAPIASEPYLVTYQAREDDNVFRIAKEIAIQTGAKRIIPLDFYNNNRKYGLNTNNYSPSDFVSLIRNATCVITTSFHGTAFSVICGTPFYSLRLNDGADERINNLLSQLELKHRFINKNETPVFSSMDYKNVFKLLSDLRADSLQFLKDNLR